MRELLLSFPIDVVANPKLGLAGACARAMKSGSGESVVRSPSLGSSVVSRGLGGSDRKNQLFSACMLEYLILTI